MSEEKTEITKPTDFEFKNLKKQPCLIVMSGNDLAKKHPIVTPETIIGRSADAHVVVKEHNISRRHAKIVVSGKKFTVKDLGSTNGTYVNSERITDCDLEDGDLINVGKTILKFSIQSDIDSAFHEEIYDSATNDDLTRLFNRKYFQKHLESEYARGERYGRDLSVLMLDLDNFKEVNDTFGHPAGDMVLRKVGDAIRSCIRNNVDVPSRYGGEEFAVLLPETNEKFAFKIAEKIRKKIEALPLISDGKEIAITISIGVAANRAELTTAEALMKAADEKLYLAKNKGKNRTQG